MTERLQAGNDASSTRAAIATSVRRKKGRDEITDTTFHYNPVLPGADCDVVVAKMVRGRKDKGNNYHGGTEDTEN